MALNRFHGGIDLTMLKHTWQGEWNEGVIYNINDVVKLGGKSFVCINTEMSDRGWYGTDYKPGADTTHWITFTDGYLYKGQWRVRCRWYKGDVVKYNGDYYVCLEDNLHGHPIYENGALTTKWRLAFKSSERNKTKRNIWMMNMPPMGWTRNYASDSNEQHGFIDSGAMTIDGNFNVKMIGKTNTAYNYGMGTIATWIAEDAATTSDAYIHPRIGTFDFWDYIDGYRPSINGGTPRVVQVTSSLNVTYVLFDNGEVYAAGYNSHGQLGDGSTTHRLHFVRVGRSTGGRGSGVLRDEHIIKVSISQLSGEAYAGATGHALMLTREGRVYATGYNGYGTIGDGTTTNRTTPYLIPQWQFNGKKVVDIWAGGYDYQHSVVQTEDDCLYYWGENSYAAGPGTQNIYTPKKVAYDFRKFGGIKKVYAIGHGSVHNILVLTNDGQLHFSGYHYTSQNYSGGKGGNGGAYWQITFWTMHDLLRERTNSFGMNSMNQLGALIDISGQIDDFWVMGDRYFGIYMKHKKTGVIYSSGYRSYVRSFVHARAAGMNDYYGNNPSLTSEGISLPTPIDTADCNDIVYMCNTYVESSYKNPAFLNSDGKVITNSSYNGLFARGIGAVTTYPFVHFQTNALPTETAMNHIEPGPSTLYRWKYPVSMMMGAMAYSSQAGIGVVTNEDRMMFSYGSHGLAFMHDSGQQATSTTEGRSAPQRLDF